MELVSGYDHQPGVHCGAAALRNVAAYYGWNYGEAACFGIGGGPAFVRYDHPEEPWATFRASPTWLERAFFERLGVPHTFREGDDVEPAWENVTARVDDDDPVVLFLDPEPLDYLAEDPHHVPPHVAVLIGYDDESVVLSDGSMDERVTVPRDTLTAAWHHDCFLSLDNAFLVVTRRIKTVEGNDAAASGLQQAATYMIDPLQVKRDARGPAEEGIPALRSFADYVRTWADHPESGPLVRAARRGIDEHGEGKAFRGLYAEALEDLSDELGRIDGRE